MASQNAALLEIAGVLEAMRTAIVNGDGVRYNPMEVLLASMQATIQIMCGGAPSMIVLPNILNPAGLNDTAVARECSGAIQATPFIFGGVNLATQTGVLADGSLAKTISFVSPFPSAATQVLYGLRDYSGSDNASLSARVVTNSLTQSGFSIIVSGGQSASTVSLDYLPFGY